ncbi:MAG: dephospho-CoA kinase [Anaerostipes sp.]|uniref:dephospho-CoA kinase n=1 Tax=Anaerostipes sp. 992a TaxID=1261637 RepID=UPI000952EE3C|nr:dephospho-CoA kinase [Anaerostipes sp. 992a]MCI5952172.1 dephospho-CoA kinase [Anaerostipes sp.]MDD5968523.1 dephospho-CoA kinase [Anaerostipes sp.]OLR63861.1 dephospho-CoA kinase [Anaerostipes sp. 992a]
MKVIGVTGGVGSGKSVILSILEKEYGAQTILADLVAHDLMEPGAKSYMEIVETFGDSILQEDGAIDRQKLGSIVFADEKKLEQLNGITHPNVKEEIKRRIAKIRKKGEASMIVLEAALLIESGYEDIYDELWYIYVNRETRYERLKEGRGYTREKTDSIMNNQLSEEEFRAHAQVIIDNSYDIEQTKKQIHEILM